MPTVLVGSGSVVGGLVTLCWLVFGGRHDTRPPRRRHRGRTMLAGLGLGTSPTDLRRAVLDRSVGERVVQPGVVALAQRARRLTPAGIVRSLERRIDLAGAGATWPIERVLAAKLVLSGGGLLVGLLALAASRSGGGLLLLVVATAAGYLGPDLLLQQAASTRQTAIQQELADILDQVTITVEAGLSFEAAVDRVARPGGSPLKQELAHMLREIQFGVRRHDALANLLTRTDVRDLRSFVHAVAQAETYGIPIAQVLRVQSGELREKRRQSAEERAMKVPVKIVMPLMLCIMPALFVVLLGPAALRIANSGLGG
jgi:tight adherence protein C